MKTKKIQTRYVMQLFAAWAMIASVCGGCTEQNVLPPATDDGAKGITLTLSIATAPMEGSGPVTREETYPKRPEETMIKTLWLLQFDGTDGDALLLQCTKVYDNAEGMQGGNLTVKFVPATKTTQGVYLVANTDMAVHAILGVAKATFNAMIADFRVSPGVPAEGLPMSAYCEFDPMTVTTAPTFTLKAMVARMEFTYYLNENPGLGNYLSAEPFDLCIYRVPNGSLFYEMTPGDGAYVSPFLTRGHEYDYKLRADVRVGGVYYGLYYIPENLAGRNTNLVLTEKTRSIANAPAEAMCLELYGRLVDGREVRIAHFLGAGGNQNDFNVVHNHIYNVSVHIMGIYRDDERITIN